MKKNCLLVLVCIISNMYSQSKYAKEFSFVNDNDLYISIENDRYYTNGIFLNYRFLRKNNSDFIDKKVFYLELSHQMFTPFKATVDTKGNHDRPFAAYLHGSFGIHYFYKDNSVLKLNAQLGVIGPNALGKELQDIIHNIYGFKKVIGWKYQIKNAIALNLDASFIKPLWTDNSKIFDVSWYNNVKLGTVFTDATTGLYTRIGVQPLQKLVNSIAFGSNLNNESTDYNNKVEVFFYAKPTVKFVHYDATIQGSFLNTESPVTYEVKNFQYAAELGLRFTSNRWNFGYAAHFHSKKLKSIRVPNTNFYGRIIVNYQFN